jgi:hypothetical protein
MPTITKMNQEIAQWLYGKGKITYSKNMLGNRYWILTVKKKEILSMDTSFDTNYNALMKAFNKVLETDGTWYAVYKYKERVLEGKGKNKKHIYKDIYYCPFTQNAMRIGYGAKLNKDFKKESIILAMHYSLYRFIKNGIEY